VAKHALNETLSFVVLLCAFLALALVPGCEKTSPEAKALLSVGTISAKERALSFEQIKGKLHAKDTADEAALQNFIGTHGAGLNSQAVALADLVEAVQKAGKLSKAARDQVTAAVATAQSRVEEWALIVPKLQLDEPLAKWVAGHGEGLSAQHDSLKKLSVALQKK